MPTTTPTRASAHADSTASTARKVMLDGLGSRARMGRAVLCSRAGGGAAWGGGGAHAFLPTLRRQHHGELPARKPTAVCSSLCIRNSLLSFP